MVAHVLDNVVWAALTGPQASWAAISGNARRFPADVSPFCAIADQSDPECWADLAKLVGPGGNAVITGREMTVPSEWEELSGGFGKQMIGEQVFGQPDK